MLRSAVAGGLGALCSPMLSFGRTTLATADVESPTVEVSNRAVDLVREATVIDMMGFLTLDWTKLSHWRRRPAEFTEADYRRLESSGIGVFHPAIETALGDAREAVERWIDGWDRLLTLRPCFLARVGTTRDLQVSKRGPIGVIVGFQNSNHFHNLADVGHFFARGQRVSQLTYNVRNRIGSGCYERFDGGLTSYGEDIVAAMNRVGMAVDISHCGERTSRDAIEASKMPVLATHSSCRELVPGQRRSKSDAVLKRLAKKGGVLGITSVRPFVNNQRTPTLDDLLDHFDHVAKIVGIEHAGIGSDLDVTARDPRTGKPMPLYSIRGLDPLARVFQIADGLLQRGHTERDVALVLGGNFARALGEIWPAESPVYPPQRPTRRDPFCPAPLPADPPTLSHGA